MTTPTHLTFSFGKHPVAFRDGRFHSPDEDTAADLNLALERGHLRSGQPVIVPPIISLAMALEREYGDAITDVQVPDLPAPPDDGIV